MIPKSLERASSSRISFPAMRHVSFTAASIYENGIWSRANLERTASWLFIDQGILLVMSARMNFSKPFRVRKDIYTSEQIEEAVETPPDY